MRLCATRIAACFLATLTLLACLVNVRQACAQALGQDSSGLSPYSVVFTPRREAILASEVGTTVLEISREFGQAFHEGDVLITLDDERFKLSRDRAEAQMAAAGRAYNVNSKLFANDSASMLEVEQARAALRMANAEYAMAKKDMDSCVITAPFDGRVNRVLLNEHETVQAGQGLLEVVDDSVLRVKTLLPSKAFRSVSVGLEVGIRVNEIDAEVVGSVSHISATMDPASGTFEIYAEVDNSQGILRSGMTGSLSLSIFEQ